MICVASTAGPETAYTPAFLLIGTWSLEVVFGFQTMHCMNSLTGSLGVCKVLFMLLLFSTKQKSFIGPCPQLLNTLQPAISRSHTYNYCTVTLTDHLPLACSINPAGVRHAYKTSVCSLVDEGTILLHTGSLVLWLTAVYPTFLYH